MTSKTDAECRAAIKEFCEITGKDEIFALELLQELDFDLEEAVVRHYSELDSGPLPDTIINEVLAGTSDSTSSRKRNPTNDDIPHSKRIKTDSFPSSSASISKNGNILKVKNNEESLNSTETSSARSQKVPIPPMHEIRQTRINDLFASVPSTSKNQDVPQADDNSPIPPMVTVMSYNIDGLDDRSAQARAIAVLHVVARANPEVIFFQEVTELHEKKFRSVLSSMYNIFSGENTPCGYYTLTAVSKNIKIVKHEIVNFESTHMGRNLLVVEAKWKDMNMKLINTHLESMWDQADVRKRQFALAMDKMKEFTADPNAFVLFGGDLNLRDPEISNVPNGVQDAWIATGSSNDHKYTWDTQLNDNKRNNFKRASRFRFDRLFVRTPYQKMDFRLEGKERIKGGLFPSDHFAIVCKFTKPRLS